MFKTKKSKIISAVALFLVVATVAGIFVPLGLQRNGSNTGSSITSVQGVYGQRMSDYAELYDQEGLVACYMGYDTSTLTFVRDEEAQREYYTWRNYAKNGHDAVLTSVSQWQGMLGGIGYDIIYNGTGPYNASARCVIPYDLSFSGIENYEVECVANFRGLTDKEGNRIFLNHADKQWGVYQQTSTFRFGELHACSYITGTDHVNSNYVQRWYLSNLAYTQSGHWDTTTNSCYKLYDDKGLSLFNHWEGRENHAVCMSVRRSVKNNFYTLGVEYTHGGDVLYSNTNQEPIGEDVVSGINAVTYSDPVSAFTLFEGYPGVMYGVRLYDRVLDEGTRLRNAFVDFCAFYRVNISAFFNLSSEELTVFLEACGRRADRYGVAIDPNDAANGWCHRSLVYDIIDECWPG